MKRIVWVLLGYIAFLSVAHADFVSDRINAAILLPRVLQLSWGSLSSLPMNSKERRDLKRDYRTQLDIRGNACQPLFSPSSFTTNQEIVDRLAASTCLEKANTALGEWLGSRHVEALLSMPPLRSQLSTVPPAVTGNNIQVAKFAAEAGVGLLWANQRLDIVDLHNNSRIFHRENVWNGMPGEFSLNGRLLAIPLQSGSGLMDTETGEILTNIFAFVNEIYWLNDRLALYADASNNGMWLVDFHAGVKRKVDFLQERIKNVAVLPGRPGVFIAFSESSVMLFSLESKSAEPHLNLLMERPFKVHNAFRYPGILSSDGKYFISLSGDIAITSTDTLETEVISLSPFSVNRAVPLANGEEFLLSGTLTNSNKGSLHYVYSITDHTLAKVELEKFAANQYASFAYLPGARATACISRGNISFFSSLPLEAPITAAQFVSQSQQETRAMVNEDLSAMGIQRRFNIPSSGGGISQASAAIVSSPVITSQPPVLMKGSVTNLAGEADIMGIAVYQATNSESIGQNQKLGTIRVNVDKNSKPILLILSSYYSVNWKLNVQPDARLSAVLVSSHDPSSVEGSGNAKVISIGDAYGYQLGTPEYETLEHEIVSWTGRKPIFFQGTYEGAQFSVGRNDAASR